MNTDNMNRKICVIGGGPAGLSCALWLKYLGMSPIILEKNDKIGGLQHSNYYQNSWYIGITFRNRQDHRETLWVDFICFRIGFSPNVTPIAQLLQDNGVGTLELTAGGYIKRDEFCRTSIPRIYAAGDVSNQRDPCIATAVAQGTIAARSLEEDLRSLCWKST